MGGGHRNMQNCVKGRRIRKVEMRWPGAFGHGRWVLVEIGGRSQRLSRKPAAWGPAEASQAGSPAFQCCRAVGKLKTTGRGTPQLSATPREGACVSCALAMEWPGVG